MLRRRAVEFRFLISLLPPPKNAYFCAPYSLCNSVASTKHAVCRTLTKEIHITNSKSNPEHTKARVNPESSSPAKSPPAQGAATLPLPPPPPPAGLGAKGLGAKPLPPGPGPAPAAAAAAPSGGPSPPKAPSRRALGATLSRVLGVTLRAGEAGRTAQGEVVFLQALAQELTEQAQKQASQVNLRG